MGCTSASMVSSGMMDYCGFTDAKQFRFGVFDAHAHRVSRRQMNPIESSLYIRETGLVRPITSASGVTPKPMLSTKPRKRRSGFDT